MNSTNSPKKTKIPNLRQCQGIVKNIEHICLQLTKCIHFLKYFNLIYDTGLTTILQKETQRALCSFLYDGKNNYNEKNSF